jgi:hypothetical protein
MSDDKRRYQPTIYRGFGFWRGWGKVAGDSAVFCRLKIDSCIVVHKISAHCEYIRVP